MSLATPPVNAFPQTRWTLIRRVSAGTPEQVEEALEELCKAYWYPLYAIARMKGSDPEEAADYVQGFFAHGLANGLFARADQERGRLRSFLLRSFSHFVGNEQARTARSSRGGGCEWIEISDAERRFESELVTRHDSVERIFMRQWALSVLERALQKLQREYEKRGELNRFIALEPHLPLSSRESGQVAAAAEMGMSNTAFRTALHRIRKQYRLLVIAEVRQTVASDDPAEVEEELNQLMAALQ